MVVHWFSVVVLTAARTTFTLIVTQPRIATLVLPRIPSLGTTRAHSRNWHGGLVENWGTSGIRCSHSNAAATTTTVTTATTTATTSTTRSTITTVTKAIITDGVATG